MARVSVVVPSSNQRDLLRSTLDSILGQSYREFELLISDDGSVDGTGMETLSRLGPDALRAEQVWRDSLQEETGTRCIQMNRSSILIHYFHHVLPKGKSAARNRAIAFASGEYLAFVEPGDVWHPRKLEIQMQVAEKYRELGACVGPITDGTAKPNGSRRRPPPTKVEFDEVLLPPGLLVSGAILKRGILDGESPFDENLPSCEEYDFWLRLASRFQIGRVLEPLQTSAEQTKNGPWSLDRYRVYSMEKAFQGGHLNPLQRHRVAEVLVDRCGRLAQGFRQKNNLERASFYERKKKRFVAEVTKLDLSDPLFTQKRKPRRLTGAPA